MEKRGGHLVVGKQSQRSLDEKIAGEIVSGRSFGDEGVNIGLRRKKKR